MMFRTNCTLVGPFCRLLVSMDVSSQIEYPLTRCSHSCSQLNDRRTEVRKGYVGPSSKHEESGLSLRGERIQIFGLVPFMQQITHHQRMVKLDGAFREPLSFSKEARIHLSNSESLNLPIQCS